MNPIIPTTSYATVAESDVFPKKDQAIIIESRPDIPLDEYTAAVGKLIGANSIRFASRMSHGRICMFLDSKQTADDLTEKHTSITIQNHILELRPLITKFQRLILSNVCPVVPHSIIKTALENVGITTTSPITFLRAGLSNPGFTHILSFRRQVYIHPDNVPNIPESLQINYDDTSYWIYLSTDNLTCFLCKKSGHIAKNCTAAQQNKPDEKAVESIDTATKKSPPKKHDSNSNLQNKDFPGLPPSQLELMDALNTPGTKRTHSTISSTNTDKSENLITNTDENISKGNDNSWIPAKPNSKKPKKISAPKTKSITTDDLLNSVEPLFENSSANFILNYMQFKSFFEKATGSANPAAIANDYTDDIQGLINMLKEIYPNLTERTAKLRCTKIINRLVKAEGNIVTSSDEESPSNTEET